MRVPVAASSGEPEPESVHLRWRYRAGLEKAGFKGRPWICTKRYVSGENWDMTRICNVLNIQATRCKVMQGI
jgi:hypothetical protein